MKKLSVFATLLCLTALSTPLQVLGGPREDALAVPTEQVEAQKEEAAATDDNHTTDTDTTVNTSDDGPENEEDLNPEVTEEGTEVETEQPKMGRKTLSETLRKEDILYYKRLWREVNCKALKNKALFYTGKELPKFVIEGVLDGSITAYEDEECQKPLTPTQFQEHLIIPVVESAIEDDDESFTDDVDWGKEGEEHGEEGKVGAPTFQPNDISILEIMEDFIFDKRRSIWIRDFKAVKFIIPAKHFAKGVNKVIGVFPFKELVEYLDSRPDAVWGNVQNSARNLKISEAFYMSMLDGKIIKEQNPDDNALADIYDDSAKASRDREKALRELENSAWTY